MIMVNKPCTNPRDPKGETAHTARGPLRAILFFLMLSMAASGMAVLPSLIMGSTLMGSQTMGVCRMSACGSKPGERKRATDLGGGEDVLDSDSNLGANAITLDQADGVAPLQTRISCTGLCCEPALAVSCLSDFHAKGAFAADGRMQRRPTRVVAYLCVLLSIELGDGILRRVQSLALQRHRVSAKRPGTFTSEAVVAPGARE